MEAIEEGIENAWDEGQAEGVGNFLDETGCDLFNESFLP
jgi:hypothetical protein